MLPFESIAYRTPSPPGTDELNRSREFCGSVPAFGLLPSIPGEFDLTSKPFFAVAALICVVVRRRRIITLLVRIRTDALRHHPTRRLCNRHRVGLLVQDVVHVRRFGNRAVRVRRVARQARNVLRISTTAINAVVRSAIAATVRCGRVGILATTIKMVLLGTYPGYNKLINHLNWTESKNSGLGIIKKTGSLEQHALSSSNYFYQRAIFGPLP